MEISVVYIVGTGSAWKNNELKYSIRSVEKHLKGVGNIWIVGYKPKNIETNWINLRDSGRTATESVYVKLKKACQHPEISEDFLFFNDDYYLNKTYQADKFPFFYKELLSDTLARRKPDSYFRAVENAFNALTQKGLPVKNFELHAPMLINKVKFLEIGSSFDWKNHFGYVLKSIYANSLNIKGTLEPDLKINYPHPIETLKAMVKERKVFSSDKLVPTTLRNLLEELYPNPSKFEV